MEVTYRRSAKLLRNKGGLSKEESVFNIFQSFCMDAILDLWSYWWGEIQGIQEYVIKKILKKFENWEWVAENREMIYWRTARATC